jgi:hypothetical protein
MTTKREKVYYDWLQSLSQAGWNADKTDSIKFNSGSETHLHLHAKLSTSALLKANGYRIDTEVEHSERGEVDVVAIPTQDDQKPFAVELEHSPTQEVVEDKLSRYFEGTPFTEVFVINLNRAPMGIVELKEHIRSELGL